MLPVAGPDGLVADALVYGPYQSFTHSQTLPIMSYRPHALACLPAAACVFPPVFMPYHAIASSAPYVSPVVPARAAYSHSASVGNRYVTPGLWAFKRCRKVVMSSQFTVSTGQVSPQVEK